VLNIGVPKSKDTNVFISLIKDHQKNTNLLNVNEIYLKIKEEDKKTLDKILKIHTKD
jgi:hypothetical protein